MTWTGKNEVLDEVIGRAELERMLEEAGALPSRRIPAGAMVFWSGEPDGNHYYVESGSVGCTASMPPGARKSSTATVPACSSVPYPARHQSDDVDGAVRRDSRILAHSKGIVLQGCFAAGARISPEYCVRYLFGLLSMRPTRC